MNRTLRSAAIIAASLAAALLAGCAQLPAWLSGEREVEVNELRRLSVCNTAGGDLQLSVLQDAGAVAAIEAARGIHLIGDAPLPPGPFLLIELGHRPTGGRAVVVSHRARADSAELTLSGTFLEPAAGAPVPQAETSPCVLIALPVGSPAYQRITLEDPTGHTRARWIAGQAPAAAAAGPER